MLALETGVPECKPACEASRSQEIDEHNGRLDTLQAFGHWTAVVLSA